MSSTKALIDFICDQELDLENYEKLVPMIRERFHVLEKKKGHTGTVEAADLLVDRVIRWEKGEQDASLELTLYREFYIEKRKSEPGKTIIVPFNDPNIPKLKKDTTHVAGVINKEMISLQKKYPDYNFDLSFEKQRLGKQTFYRIHIKTNKNG